MSEPSSSPDPDYQSEVYDRYLTTSYAQRNDLSAAGLKHASEVYARQFEQYFPADRGSRILEIGAGVGAFLDTCRSLGFAHVVGVDISQEQVDFCRSRGHGDVHCADGVSFLEDSDERFDFVVLLDVLEHVPKAQGPELLRAVLSHLSPGGRVLIQVPNMSNPLNIQARYGDFTHEVGFSKESLEQLLRICGFEIEFVRGHANPHRNFLSHWLFDVIAWKLFLIFYKRTMQLKAEVHAGKNLLAIARRPEA